MTVLSLLQKCSKPAFLQKGFQIVKSAEITIAHWACKNTAPLPVIKVKKKSSAYPTPKKLHPKMLEFWIQNVKNSHHFCTYMYM